MQQIKLAFSDFYGPRNPDAITELLSREYEVIVTDQNPDYVIYSVFGYRFFEFSGAIRIFFTGENVHPDFNLCDYAFGYDWLQFEDRYCRCPNYQLYDEFREMRQRRRTIIPSGSRPANRERFCNFIYSNGNAHPFRAELFHRLCRYKKVDSAGPYLNNTGFTAGSALLGADATLEKINFQRQCKFSLAVENSSSVGYTTEKLVHALAADTIPIYWGNPAVGREFNERRFVNCHAFGSLEEIISRIEEIDRNDALYESILNEPFFPDDQVPESLTDEAVLAQFRRIFSQSKADARRRNEYVWGRMYEERRRREVQTRPSIKDKVKRGLRVLKRGLRSAAPK